MNTFNYFHDVMQCSTSRPCIFQVRQALLEAGAEAPRRDEKTKPWAAVMVKPLDDSKLLARKLSQENMEGTILLIFIIYI